jgi:outer membrane protein
VDVAQARIAAGRAQLDATEAGVMLAVITAYSDVLRDTQALDVRRQHLEMLAHQLEVAKARQTAGEATLTDVAQAEAQLAGVRALVSDAQNQLQVSRAAYATVVGQNPGELTPEPELPGIPVSVDEAFKLAEAQSPDLALAEQNEAISHAQVVAARVAYRPSIAVSANAGYATASQPFFSRSNDWDVSALATLTAPLFTNGAAASGVRQAVEQNTSDRIAVEGARRTVVQNVADAWNQMITARADVGFQQEQVRAAGEAFTGMQIEYDAGERSTLDVLLAEETLRNAEIALLVAEHDQYVGAASVLRDIGKLQGANLVQNLPQYDPKKHFKHVRNSGMAPWTGAVLGIDQIALPAASTHPIPEPPPAAQPSVTPRTAPVPPDAPLATALPAAK